MATAPSAQQQQQPPQQYNRGILPSETLNALDYLVDRINAASGHLPADPSSSPSPSSQPLKVLLVGTNEGVGLSRSLGTAHTSSLLHSSSSMSGSMSEEVLSTIETVWATLVGAPPLLGRPSSHPLLAPLRLGGTVRCVTACYDNVTLMHVHLAPLVVTLIADGEVNLGFVRQEALPRLKVVLEPVRRALVRSREESRGRMEVPMQQQQQQYQQQQQRGNSVPVYSQR